MNLLSPLPRSRPGLAAARHSGDRVSGLPSSACPPRSHQRGQTRDHAPPIRVPVPVGGSTRCGPAQASTRISSSHRRSRCGPTWSSPTRRSASPRSWGSIDTSSGQLAIEDGHIDEPDLTITTDYETAKTLFVQQDPAAAMQAVFAGKIKVQGDMSKLLALQLPLNEHRARRSPEKSPSASRPSPPIDRWARWCGR